MGVFSKSDFTEIQNLRQAHLCLRGAAVNCPCTGTVWSHFLGMYSLALPHVMLPWTRPTACLQGIWSSWELMDFLGLHGRVGYG